MDVVGINKMKTAIFIFTSEFLNISSAFVINLLWQNLKTVRQSTYLKIFVFKVSWFNVRFFVIRNMRICIEKTEVIV